MVRTERGTEKEGDELHCWKGSGVWCVVCGVCVCSWVAKRSDDEIVQLLSNRFFRPGVTIFKFQMSATCRSRKHAPPPPIENTTPSFSGFIVVEKLLLTCFIFLCFLFHCCC